MDNDEAKFLIDQFNKYASWAQRSIELALSVLALMLVLIMFIASDGAGSSFIVYSLGMAMFIIIYGYFVYLYHSRRHDDLVKRLSILDDYRRKSMLPDGLNLDRVIDTTGKKLPALIDKLLAEDASERRVMTDLQRRKNSLPKGGSPQGRLADK